MKSPKQGKNKVKKAARPIQDAPKSFMEAQNQMAAVQELLLKMFEGTSAEADEKRMNDSLKSIGSLLGFSQTSVEEDPEQLQLGMLRAFKTISEVSKNALLTANKPQNTETAKLFALIRDFEKVLAQHDAELSKLTQEAEALGKSEAAAPATQDALQESKEGLQAIQTGMEKLLSDENIGFERVFLGMERIMDQFASRLNIPKPAEKDIVAEVSAQVSKDLQEANKKNMIGEDFDWSSIWKKSE